MVEHQNAPHSSEHGATENQETTGQTGPANPLDTTASRRRLLRVGALSAPVVASLLSRPASATYGGGNTSARCTTSGYGHIVSAGSAVGLSPTSVAGPEDCTAKSPGFWAQKTNQQFSSKAERENGNFYRVGVPTNSPLTSLFSAAGSYGNPTSNPDSDYDNLLPHENFSAWGYLTGNNNGGFNNEWVKHFIAVYLDVVAGRLPAMLGLDLNKLFDAAVNGAVVTIGTEQWDQADAQDFIAQFYGSV